MELSRPATAGLIAVAVILVGAIGYLVLHSDSTSPSDSQQEEMHKTVAQQYQKSVQSGQGPSIYTHHDRAPMQTSTSGSGGGPSIYH